MGKHKINSKDQAQIMIHIGEMIKNGFSIIQSLDFIINIYPKYNYQISKINERLNNGDNLTNSFVELGLKQNIIDQLEISYAHGNISESFINFGKMILFRNTQRKKIIQLLSYPVFLCVMLAGLQIGLKFAGFQSITNTSGSDLNIFINIFFLSIILIGTFCLAFYIFISLQPLVKQVNFLSKIPLVGPIFLTYYHYLVIYDLTLFLRNGFSINQMIEICLKRPKHSYLYQISYQIKEDIMKGIKINSILKKYPYFPLELVNIIECGLDSKSLVIELSEFTKIIHKRLITNIEKIINKIQPTMFLLVGIGVLIVYLNILMPVFQMMKGL